MVSITDHLVILENRSKLCAVWWGVIVGVVLSGSIGTGFIVAFYVTKNSVFKGEGQAIFKGYIDMVATLLISILGFAMLRFLNYERKWQRKLEAAAQQAQIADVRPFCSCRHRDVVRVMFRPCRQKLALQMI